MKASFVSTQAVISPARRLIAKAQNDLIDARQEVSTGRHADVGNALGYRTGNVVALRHERASLITITETNGLVASRLDATQAALAGVLEIAQGFVSTVIAARSGDRSTGLAVVQGQAEAALGSLNQMLNTALNGTSLFGGLNTDQQVLSDYFADPAPPARVALATEFTTAFGLSQGDPGAELIDGADMQAFLDGSFASLFELPAWKVNWSSASDDNLRARISRNQVIDASVNANAAPFRKLAMAFTMVADLGVEKLGGAALERVLDKAVVTVSEAIAGVTKETSMLGIVQQRVEVSNQRMSIELNVITSEIIDMESVDQFEASSRVTLLLNEIEIAYAMTARIQGLSLLQYLR